MKEIGGGKVHSFVAHRVLLSGKPRLGDPAAGHRRRDRTAAGEGDRHICRRVAPTCAEPKFALGADEVSVAAGAAQANAGQKPNRRSRVLDCERNTLRGDGDQMLQEKCRHEHPHGGDTLIGAEKALMQGK